MGRAVILEDKGLGLYSVRLDYNFAAVDREIAELTEAETAYFTRLNDAFDSLDDLRRAKAEAADALNEVVQQWKDGLISKLNEEPPAIIPTEPNDPDTGEPWVDPDRAQDGPLFAAINAERTADSVATLTRNADLDRSVMRHLRTIAVTGRIRHDEKGWTAADRVAWVGYDYDATIGVGQVLAFGTRTPAATVALWMRRSSDRARILDAGYTECGVGYVYAPDNPYSYLWGAVFAAPGPPLPEFVEPEPDPAQEAADEAESVLEKIPLPTIEGFEPGKFGDVAAELGRAAQRVTAAERAVQELLAEKIERGHRLAALQALKDRADAPLDAWATRPPDFLGVGDSTDTAEIPGFYSDDPQTVTRTFVIEIGSAQDFTRTYDERPLNLLPPGLGDAGQLTPVDGMSAAAAFHAAAIEPGWARWRPTWRYGTITEKNGDACSLTLETRAVRQIRGVPNEFVLDAPDQLNLTAVPISYPPCNGEAFLVGDQVLVLFEGQDRDRPKVIGFKFAPRVCLQGRMSWGQL